MKTIICKACGKEVDRKTPAQKYCCDKCRQTVAAARYKSPYKNNDDANQKQGLVDINSLARELGMTYGQYVASLYRQAQLR